MSHENDRYNFEFKVAVKDLTAEQIERLLEQDLNQLDANVLRTELRVRDGRLRAKQNARIPRTEKGPNK
jgi:hypothetical protein